MSCRKKIVQIRRVWLMSCSKKTIQRQLRKTVWEIEDMVWMEEQEREEWFSELDLRLRARLSELARRSGVMDQVGRPELTTELVVDVRRGKEGVGVYQAMKRKLQKSADRDASDWLWWTVAALQHEGVVSASAQRQNRGRTTIQPQQLNWRAALAVDWKSWEGMKLKAVEIVARIQGDVEQGVVPLLKIGDRRQYGQLLKRLVPSGAVREALLWVMSVEYGVQVEGLREQMDNCVLLTSVEELQGLVGGLERAEEQLSETAGVVRGWLAARDQQAGNRTALFWFAGWAAKARRVAAELGLELVAVDWRQLEHRHRLDVQMDLLQIAPQFWVLEAARRTGKAVADMVVHWAALPCTTAARNDASNKVRKDTVTGEMVEVFYNYRLTKDKYRRPQHSVGTQKGDDCREADRLLLAALWVMQDSGLSGVLEQPDGQMQRTKPLRRKARWLERVDYCRLWSEWERKQGMKWQKMTCLWVMRADGRKMQLGDSLKCGGKCKCRKGNSNKHVGQVEAMTEVMQKTGMKREQLKCVYPAELLRRVLGFLTEE